MAPVLYMLPASPPVRAVLMTAKYLNIDLEKKVCNVRAGDQFQEEYLKLNPAHTIPTLVDGDFVLWESNAIMTYLVDTYGKNDSLYPKDTKKRAVVDQLLHFSTSTFTRILLLVKPIVVGGNKKSTIHQDPAKVDDLFHNVEIAEKILADKKYLTGDNLTIADFAFVSWYSTMNVTFDIPENKYPKITAWWQRLQKEPWYEPNREGLALFQGMWAGIE